MRHTAAPTLFELGHESRNLLQETQWERRKNLFSTFGWGSYPVCVYSNKSLRCPFQQRSLHGKIPFPTNTFWGAICAENHTILTNKMNIVVNNCDALFLFKIYTHDWLVEWSCGFSTHHTSVQRKWYSNNETGKHEFFSGKPCGNWYLLNCGDGHSKTRVNFDCETSKPMGDWETSAMSIIDVTLGHP